MGVRGLRGDQLGLVGLTFLSVSAILPGSIYLVVSRNAIAYAGVSAPLAFLVGALMMMLNVTPIYIFSSRVASAGGFYKFVEHGSGSRRASLVVGMVQALGQASPVIITPIAIAWILRISLETLYGVVVPLWALLVLGLSVQAFMFVVSYLGVRLSGRVAMAGALAQILIILGGAAYILARSPYKSAAPFELHSSPTGFFLGVLLGPYTAYVGYSSIVSFGEEARLPRQSIKRSILLSMVLMIAFYTVVEYAIVVGVPASSLDSISRYLLPSVIVYSRYLGRAYSTLALAVALSGYYTGVLVFGSSAERTLYSLARDGLLPAWLGSVSGRGTPSAAAAAVFITSAVASLASEAVMVRLYGVGVGLLYALLFWVTVLTVCNLGYHMAVNQSLSALAARVRLGGAAAITHYVIPSLGTALSAVVVYYSVMGLRPPLAYSLALVVAWAVVGALLAALRGR